MALNEDDDIGAFGGTEHESGDKAATDDLEQLFSMFARFGEPRSCGDLMCLKNFEKWVKQAKLKNVTSVDAPLYFSKVCKGRKTIAYKEFLEVVEYLARAKHLKTDSVMQQLRLCGPPKPTNPTKFDNHAVYDRLTDRSKFTGVQKRKFDELREKSVTPPREAASFTGYVNGYKLAGTYKPKNH